MARTNRQLKDRLLELNAARCERYALRAAMGGAHSAKFVAAVAVETLSNTTHSRRIALRLNARLTPTAYTELDT